MSVFVWHVKDWVLQDAMAWEWELHIEGRGLERLEFRNTLTLHVIDGNGTLSQ